MVIPLECAISLSSDLGEPQPLLINPETNEFLVPTAGDGFIEIEQDENIILYCSRGFSAPFKGDTIVATCISGTEFLAQDEEVEFHELTCTRLPEHSTRRTRQQCIGGEIVQIGFEFGEEKWLNLMDVCHDEEKGATLWVHYYQNPENQGYQRSYPRINFIQSDFYKGLPVNALYTRNRQRDTIGRILGSRTLGENLIAQRGDLFLSRGHLAARSDFIFGIHQQATFYFLNAAPQWQQFNGGNWATLEDHLKRYVDRKNIRVEIYTGTYGVLTFDDVNGEPQEIYLATNGTDQRIPVPKIFYKVVIDEKENAGIVFVGVNNPYATMDEIQKDYVYCDNVMDQVDYIPWNTRRLQMGYLYACSVSDFMTRFADHFPGVKSVHKLLA